MFAKAGTGLISMGAVAALGMMGAAQLATPTTSVRASDDAAKLAAYPWPHDGALSGIDYGAVRRGFHVYRNVCASCHHVQFFRFRHLTGKTHTATQVKAIAASYDAEDIDDAGEPIIRPAKPHEGMPAPYKNKTAAAVANNGAAPPDLTLMTRARFHGADYVFSLLTGFCEPPAGKSLNPGQYYNPYFPGGALSMAPPLSDGQVDYEDGTNNTQSQLAKDVTTFMFWIANPTHDEHKQFGMRALPLIAAWGIALGWYKRYIWSGFRSTTMKRVPKMPY
ncbi:MAG: hypothetical protein MHM6MM_000111 [Cercozoa sp. M6MM]